MGTPDDRLGNDPSALDAYKIRGTEYFTYWQFCIGLSICLVKASISIALLRLATAKAHRIILWVVVVSSGATGAGAFTSLFIVCKPLQATWNPGLGQCIPYSLVTNLSYIFSAVTIPTDFVCAILPLFIFRRLQMPRRTKNTLLAILGLGMFAGLGTIVRVPYMHYYNAEQDRLCKSELSYNNRTCTSPYNDTNYP